MDEHGLARDEVDGGVVEGQRLGDSLLISEARAVALARRLASSIQRGSRSMPMIVAVGCDEAGDQSTPVPGAGADIEH